MRGVARVATAVLAAVCLASCGETSSDDTPDTPEGTTTTSPAKSEAPAFRVVEKPRASGPGYVIVEVESAENLRAVFDAVRERFDEDDRGFRVSIDCATGGTKDVANRLANGAYANGTMGAAQTGLEEGGSEFEVQPDAKCP